LPEDQAIAIEISAPADNESTWVAIGFRPESRKSQSGLDEMGTGRHMNFGMSGADVVVGSVVQGVRTLYAYDFVGEPYIDSSLTIDEVSATYSSGRITVAFTRKLTDGFLHDNYGVHSSILSPFADIIWAIGADSNESESRCAYHGYTRGLRMVDWVNPETIFGDATKC
jgi:hypothetical protein